MKRTTPPFRADHVGSYLRTPAITEARAKRDKGQISAADLKKVEDQEIPKVIKKQEEVGLQCATDGEYRRMFWHYDFYDGARQRRDLRASTTASSSRACRPSRRASASPARSTSATTRCWSTSSS